MSRNGIELGRLLGIKLRLDWSWLLIFVFVTWSLASQFGQLHDDWSTVLTWGTALSASLLFFVSVLIHEYAHSLMAEARGIDVRGITLFLFGGVSNIEQDPGSPATEFLVTIVGPISSAVLGFIALFIAGIGMPSQAAMSPESISQLGPVTTVLGWLGSINIALAVFNMVPGFPLDGGRLLRSGLWAAIGDLRKATRWASLVGQAVAWVFILAGGAAIFGAQVPLVGSGLGNGLWIVFIGWFLNTAAQRSYRRVVINDVLEDVPVKRIMEDEPRTVAPDITLDTLVEQYMMENDDKAFPVTQNGELVGLITLEDVRDVSNERRASATVEDVMTPASQMETIEAEEDAADAFSQLARREVSRLPILREGRLVGLITRRDIIRWLQLQSDLELAN